jgi:rubrerythrin
MSSCTHTTLELLPEPKQRWRCRACHLTIAGEDLKDGFCPECFDSSGIKRYDFEELAAADSRVTRYRCEECGVIVKAG